MDKFNEIVDRILDNPEIVHSVSEEELHYKDGIGESLLHFFLIEGKINICKLLVSRGLSINTKNKYGENPFYDCCKVAQHESVAYLVSQGADVNFKSESEGETPLHLCAYRIERSDYRTLYNFLISNGADNQAINDFGETPEDIVSEVLGR